MALLTMECDLDEASTYLSVVPRFLCVLFVSKGCSGVFVHCIHREGGARIGKLPGIVILSFFWNHQFFKAERSVDRETDGRLSLQGRH